MIWVSRVASVKALRQECSGIFEEEQGGKCGQNGVNKAEGQ